MCKNDTLDPVTGYIHMHIYDVNKNPLYIDRNIVNMTIQAKIAAWEDSVGGGLQYALPMPIK